MDLAVKTGIGLWFYLWPATVGFQVQLKLNVNFHCHLRYQSRYNGQDVRSPVDDFGASSPFHLISSRRSITRCCDRPQHVQTTRFSLLGCEAFTFKQNMAVLRREVLRIEVRVLERRNSQPRCTPTIQALHLALDLLEHVICGQTCNWTTLCNK